MQPHPIQCGPAAWERPYRAICSGSEDALAGYSQHEQRGEPPAGAALWMHGVRPPLRAAIAGRSAVPCERAAAHRCGTAQARDSPARHRPSEGTLLSVAARSVQRRSRQAGHGNSARRQQRRGARALRLIRVDDVVSCLARWRPNADPGAAFYVRVSATPRNACAKCQFRIVILYPIPANLRGTWTDLVQACFCVSASTMHSWVARGRQRRRLRGRNGRSDHRTARTCDVLMIPRLQSRRSQVVVARLLLHRAPRARFIARPNQAASRPP